MKWVEPESPTPLWYSQETSRVLHETQLKNHSAIHLHFGGQGGAMLPASAWRTQLVPALSACLRA